mgnify:CR=1 FL=1
MRIVAPVSRVAEVAVLAEAGATELYCGLVPPDWRGRFQSISANRRPSGNLASYADLAEAVRSAHAHAAALSLVLNAQHYAAAQIEAAEEIAGRFADLGGDALIVSDLGLVERLATRFPALRVHVSSVATCRNAAAARLCQALGARRLILPRDVTLAEATAIAEEVPDIEIEAFVLNDGCIFEEGACHTIHLPGQLGGPICLDRYRFRHRRRDGGELARACARLGELEQRLAPELTLIEGAGGLWVPMPGGSWLPAWISAMRAEVIVVGRLGLGTINHCLLTFAGLRQLGLAPRGFILAQTRAEADPSTADNERVIAASSELPCLGVLGFAPGPEAHAWLRGGVRGLLG